ncbi:MAG: VWA-like domain-containing protein [Eubacteriales bacterium]|nr:VWA-like domain-containing protein [Eubacteriales bacterium]
MERQRDDNRKNAKPKLGRVIQGGHAVRVDLEREAAAKQAEEADARARERRMLAMDIMKLSRQKLVERFRFLDRALFRMPLVSSDDVDSWGTNGTYMWFSARQVIEDYRAEKNRIPHAFLHMILHCLYQHPFQYQKMDQILWDLACDLAVEKTIGELGIDETHLSDDDLRQQVMEDLEADMREAILQAGAQGTPSGDTDDTESLAASGTDGADPEASARRARENAVAKTLRRAFTPGNGKKKRPVVMTAETMYRYFLDHPDKADVYLGRAYTAGSGSFLVDEHRLWTVKDVRGVDREVEGGDRYHDDIATGQLGCHDADFAEEGDGDFEDDVSEVFAGQSQGGWQDVSDHAQNDLQVISREQGFGVGSMTQNLRAVNEETYDYTEFLKRFAVPGEEVHVNMDEFDNIYYTYGLKMYGNLPLIEPLEYRESRRIREFVIAIDTSGSCKGSTVEKFLRKTYGILKNSESYFDQVNIHILQCDEKVQKDDVITNAQEFEDYMKDVSLQGFGGTDFRPVFRYVDQMVERRVFHDLKGLLYFTDGYGSFPEVMPAYETAFIFVDEGYVIPDVPPWAVRLVLEEDAI